MISSMFSVVPNWLSRSTQWSMCAWGEVHASGILLCLQHVYRRCYHGAVLAALFLQHCVRFYKKDSRKSGQSRQVCITMEFSSIKNSRVISIQYGFVVKVIKRLGFPKWRTIAMESWYKRCIKPSPPVKLDGSMTRRLIFSGVSFWRIAEYAFVYLSVRSSYRTLPQESNMKCDVY